MIAGVDWKSVENGSVGSRGGRCWTRKEVAARECPSVRRHSQVAAGGNGVLPGFDRVGDKKELKIRSNHRHQACPSLLQEEAGAVASLCFSTRRYPDSRGESAHASS